jgi:hypothetical protein
MQGVIDSGQTSAYGGSVVRGRVVGGMLAAFAIAGGVGLALALSATQPAAAKSATGGATITTTTTTVAATPRHVRHYSGHVSDGKRTPFRLEVRFRHSRPAALIAVDTGELALACKVGSESRRLDFRWPPGGARLRPKLEGYFNSQIENIEPDGTRDSLMRVRGLVETRRAMGALRIKTRNAAHGPCNSSTLAWQARRH